MPAYAESGQDVGGIVRAHKRSLQDPAVRKTEPEERLLRSHRQYLNLIIFNAVWNKNHARAALRHRHQIRITSIDKNLPVMGGHIVIEGSLGLFHAVEGTESQKMGLADIGDYAVVRLAHLHEFFNVIRMAGTHFDHGNFHIRSKGKNGQRNADIIVQIALSGLHIELCGKHSTDEFLGRSLAVGPGDPYYGEPWRTHILTVMAGQCLQCLQCGRNRDDAASSG